MRKFLLIVWLLDSSAIVWLFAYIRLYGNTPDRINVAGDLGAIWGVLAATLGWKIVSEKWKARRKS